MPRPKPLRVAVIGHAEHVTIARVLALPRPGEILHLEDPFGDVSHDLAAFLRVSLGPAGQHQLVQLWVVDLVVVLGGFAVQAAEHH